MIIASSLLLLLAASDATTVAPDTDPPIIEDVAAASANPRSAPIITARISDRDSGVAAAAVHFRATGTEDPWKAVALAGGSSRMFMARLPDGLQLRGFEYYVEATDIAGNGPARIGSPEAPIRVERASALTITPEKFEEPPPAIHPGWLMLSLGVGVLASGAGGAFAFDLYTTNNKLHALNDALASGDVTDVERAAILSQREAFETAALQDTVFGSVFGVVGAVALITGGTLVVIASLNE